MQNAVSGEHVLLSYGKELTEVYLSQEVDVFQLNNSHQYCEFIKLASRVLSFLSICFLSSSI